jgi:hypothetical protein
MTKLLCLALLVGAAATDTEAPVISLDFAVPAKHGDGVGNRRSCEHPNGKGKASSRADFYCECVLDVCDDSDLPTANAFDHHEGSVSVTTGFELFVDSPPCTRKILNANNNDCPADSPDSTNHKDVEWNRRGEWVLTYDAKDDSGNEAESVKFAMAIMDIDAPTANKHFQNITWVYGEKPHYPGHANNKHFDDNYDRVVDVRRITTEKYGRCTRYTENADGSPTATPHEDKYEVCDYAGIFGDNYVDNCATFSRFMHITTSEHTFLEGDSSTIQDSILIDGVTGKPATSDVLECQDGPLGSGNFKVHESNDDVVVKADSCHCINKKTKLNACGYHNGVGGTPFSNDGSNCGECTWHLDQSSYPSDVGQIAVQIRANIPGQPNHLVPSATRTFEVVDTTPPQIVMDWTAAQKHFKSKVGEKANPASFDKDSTGGNDYYHYLGKVEGDNKHGGMDMDSDARKHAASGGLNTNLDLTNNMLVQHSAGYTLDSIQLNSIVSFHYCEDACDKTNELTEQGSWHQLADEDADCEDYSHDAKSAIKNIKTHVDKSDGLNILMAGTFVFKYTCKDSSDNYATPKCTTVINQDHTKPIVNAIEGINGICADLNLEGTCYYADDSAIYDDGGAICSDMVDGDISELVTVSGDVVDLAVVDTYHITYDCVDTSGNDAEQAYRDVFVIDRTCPTCELKQPLVTIEASFPYTAPKVFCSDTMPFQFHGKDYTVDAIVTGDKVDVEEVGTYFITYSATDSAGNTNTNYEYNAPGKGTTCNAGVSHVRTVIVEDSLVPIITLRESLMEETHDSVNAWIIGALASAVAGVALLGYATQKASATMVPV